MEKDEKINPYLHLGGQTEMSRLKAKQILQFKTQSLAAHRSISLALRPFSFELVVDFEISCITKITLNFCLLLNETLEAVATQFLSQQPLVGAEQPLLSPPLTAGSDQADPSWAFPRPSAMCCVWDLLLSFSQLYRWALALVPSASFEENMHSPFWVQILVGGKGGIGSPWRTFKNLTVKVRYFLLFLPQCCHHATPTSCLYFGSGKEGKRNYLSQKQNPRPREPSYFSF